DKLHGSWVLVRMRSDNFGGKRTNWLLIKHRDKFAKNGHGEAILDKDHSVASGRAMTAIQAGTGKKPKPFMRAKAFKADAVWQSKSRKDDKDEDPEPAPKTIVKPRKISKLPGFVEPQLCRLVDQPPSGPNWVHEVKFDGYRMQLRVEKGKARLLT